MEPLYPLRFRPIFRDYLWGGNRLAEVLRKSPGIAPPVAESWEIVDHDADQSVVENGMLAGTTLRRLMQDYGEKLVGEAVWKQVCDPQQPEHLQQRFPLLFKFLDANRALSVQVHPNDEQGSQLDPPDLGKTEAWVVMDAEPGSLIYAGLKAGVDRTSLLEAMRAGETDKVLHSFEPNVGDCVFIPAGTVHAIGAGLLIGEIQQASDTTYRMFDWNRVGADGKARPLHIDQAIEVVDFERGPVDAQTPQPSSDERANRLIECDKFVMDRWSLNGQPCHFHRSDSFQLFAVTAGSIMASYDQSEVHMTRGETLLIPADIRVEVTTESPATLLCVHVDG